MGKVMVVADASGSDEDVSCRFLRNNTRPASFSWEVRRGLTGGRGRFHTVCFSDQPPYRLNYGNKS
jgi:hypothetical protein